MRVDFGEVAADEGAIEFGEDGGSRFALEEEADRGFDDFFGRDAAVGPQIIVGPVEGDGVIACLSVVEDFDGEGPAALGLGFGFDMDQVWHGDMLQ